MKAVRDAAALATGFAAALRRSEICVLQFADVEFVDRHGMVLYIRRSKTGQQGAGQSRGATRTLPGPRFLEWAAPR